MICRGGRHRRRSTKIMATVKGAILLTVAMILILGSAWVYMIDA